MEQIEEENEKLEIYKDRLSEEKKELFDIRRKPYKSHESKWKRQRIENQERVVDRYEQLIENVRARIREKELAVAHRKYDAR
jgi:broad specificity phosphatase PhoE